MRLKFKSHIEESLIQITHTAISRIKDKFEAEATLHTVCTRTVPEDYGYQPRSVKQERVMGNFHGTLWKLIAVCDSILSPCQQYLDPNWHQFENMRWQNFNSRHILIDELPISSPFPRSLIYKMGLWALSKLLRATFLFHIFQKKCVSELTVLNNFISFVYEHNHVLVFYVISSSFIICLFLYLILLTIFHF